MEPQRTQRKLTTILAADVEGYTRLMRADEEATLNTLGEYREIIDGLIARHDGRIFSTGGDSVLAEFGSAVEAVRCAISCQEEISSRNAELADDRELIFRIGINVGDVMVKDGDLFGDGVNVAARLEGLAEPGGVCISGSVFEQIRHKLSLGFEDMGQQEVKNIAEPVSAYRLVPGQVSVSAGATMAARPSAARRWRMPAMAAAVVVIIAAGGLAVWRPWESKLEPASIAKMAFPLPDKPSVAVLPFDNMSGDPEQEYFADGITEDIITDLSKISGLFVIARNSTFTYKGSAVQVRQVAEDLGVRYVLEGSVRRAGSQVRINAQLIDATTGGHLWADRYDGNLEDVFALQDKVSRQIVTALSVTLTPAEKLRQAEIETDSPEAYDAFLQGWEHYRRFTPDDFVKAIPFFERAMALDSTYGRAYAALASIYWEGGSQRFWYEKLGLLWGEARTRAKEHLELALEYPTPLAHRVASLLYLDKTEQNFDQALSEAQKAIAIDPNDPEGHIAMAHALTMAGRPAEAVAFVDAAMRLNPKFPGHYLFQSAFAHFGMDQLEKAANLLESAVERNSQDLFASYLRVPTYALLGRQQEMAGAIAHVKRVSPVDIYQYRYLYYNYLWGMYKTREDHARISRGLKKAGIGWTD